MVNTALPLPLHSQPPDSSVARGARLVSVAGVRFRPMIAAALFAVYVIWGSTYLGMRIALTSLPPFFMGGVRFLIAGSILYVALRLRGAPRPARREWGAAAITGLLLLAGGNGFVALGQQWVSSGVAAVVVATMPLWIALFGSVRGERPVAREWLGLLIGFVGVAILNMGGELRAVHAGALVILLAPISWALGSLWSRSLPMPSGAMGTAAQMLMGGVAMMGISVLRGEGVPRDPTTESLVALVYLIVFGSLVAFSAYGYLLRSTRPAIATSYAYVNPVIAILLGVLAGGESTGALTWVAAAVILAGVAVLSTAKQKVAPPPGTTTAVPSMPVAPVAPGASGERTG